MKRFAQSCVVMLWVAVLCACGGGADGVMHQGPSAAVSTVNGTATFSGPRNNYSVVATSSGWSVTDHVGSDGVSNLPASTATLAFTDFTVNLGVGAKSQTISDTDLKSITELYVAFFNRVPDADGLSYWIDQFKGGMTLSQMCDNFYAAAVFYSNLTGYSSTMSNADFITVIYKNVLGRTSVDASGMTYWSNALATGAATRGTLVESILGSAHTFKGDATWGWVADLLDNKYTVAKYFAVQQGLNYGSPSQSITSTIAIAAAVTPMDTTAAIGLIGVADTSFSTIGRAAQLVRSDSTVTFSSPPTNFSTTAQCPSGMKAISGGGLVTGGNVEEFMSGSAPTPLWWGTGTGPAPTSWVMSWYPISTDGGTGNFATWATCTSALTDLVVVVTQTPSLTFASTPTNQTTTAQCPSGMKAISGGGLQEAGLELFMNGSFPDATASGPATGGWSVSWYPLNNQAGIASVATWAVCTAMITDATLVRADANVTFSAQPINQTTTAQCPSGMKAIGGGGQNTGGTTEVFLNSSWPGATTSGSLSTVWGAVWYPSTNGAGSATVSTWAVCSAGG
jgi:hypothetical protein